MHPREAAREVCIGSCKVHSYPKWRRPMQWDRHHQYNQMSTQCRARTRAPPKNLSMEALQALPKQRYSKFILALCCTMLIQAARQSGSAWMICITSCLPRSYRHEVNYLRTGHSLISDPTFVRTFFMTYRRFCSPRDVIFQFLNRLREIEGYDTSRDVKHWALQK